MNDVTSFVRSISGISSRPSDFPWSIRPEPYTNSGEVVTKEEKILGIMKTWTVIRYFYAYPERCAEDWDSVLDKYLESAQKTTSDKEYYSLIGEMMAMLNDSHAGVFHPSIFDFSEIFVVPLNFEYIENKAIITFMDSSIMPLLRPGDEITAIDGLSIAEIMEEGKKKLSYSNRQSLIAQVINPGYFAGAPGSMMKLEIRRGKENSSLELPRTTLVFDMENFGGNPLVSKIWDGHIGYLNLARLLDPAALETELRKMQSTNALILDLRNSYPTWDYYPFLSMLAGEEVTARIDKVPVVAACKNRRQVQTGYSVIHPDTDFIYRNKIFVLVDKTMVSRPEDFAIALASLPNVVFVGEQTQGTNGEMTKMALPGGGEVSFTGQKIKFGNGKEFQGIGITPDIRVNKTVKGVKEGMKF